MFKNLRLTGLAAALGAATLLAPAAQAQQIHPVDPLKLTLPTPTPAPPPVFPDPSKLRVAIPTPTPPHLIPPPNIVLPTPRPYKPGEGDTPRYEATQADTAISEEYLLVDRILGDPTSDVSPTPEQRAWHRMYKGGEIFWTPATGAHEVHGSILQKYHEFNGADGIFGAPVTDVGFTPDGLGNFSHFKNDASIYRSPRGTFEVHGAIRAEWEATGWEQGPLGYPHQDQGRTPDGIGLFNAFDRGWIYWTPDTGAHDVYGYIGARWAELGWELSYLGYPVADETDWTDAAGRPGRLSSFQYGQLGWTPQTGVQELEPDVERHHEVIDTGAFNAISSAWGDVEVRSDGYYRFSGHEHDSSDFDSYNITVTGVVLPSDGSTAFVLQPDHGYITPNHREHDWPWPQSNCGCGYSDALRTRWRVIRGAERDGRIQVFHDYTSDLEGTWNKYKDDVGKIALEVIKLVVGGGSDSGTSGGSTDSDGSADGGG